MPSPQPSQRRRPASPTLADLDTATAVTAAVLADLKATAADRLRAAEAEEAAYLTFIEETATITELAALYRDAVIHGELDGVGMYVICSRNPTSARQGYGRCSECRGASHGYHWSRLAAAVREATRGGF